MNYIGVKVRSPFSNILSLLVQENFQENSTVLTYTFTHIEMKLQCLFLCPKRREVKSFRRYLFRRPEISRHNAKEKIYFGGKIIFVTL